MIGEKILGVAMRSESSGLISVKFIDIYSCRGRGRFDSISECIVGMRRRCNSVCSFSSLSWLDLEL